jgi:dTDP-glucose pyrophosphorylase
MGAKELQNLLVTPGAAIGDVMRCIDANARGIALLVDSERRLLAAITDGDIRRAILGGLDLSAPVSELISTKENISPVGPITARAGTDDSTLLELMQRHSVRHIPLLDHDGSVVGLARLEELLQGPLPLKAVVMAGGFGKRLHPLTESTPKPLLNVGDRSLLQRTVKQLRDANIHRVSITTHFLGDQIRERLGDGRELGISIEYLSEDRPLGTAGALGLLDVPTEPILVINGDILTRLNFNAMLHFHEDYAAAMTVAIKQYEMEVPYGVVEVEGATVTRLSEKPKQKFFVIAGIYLLDPQVWSYLPRGEFCDMPDLINSLLAAGKKVVSFPISEYWLDIGRLDDYERAQADVANGAC